MKTIFTLFLTLFFLTTYDQQLYGQVTDEVVINEFMASNETTATDPAGEFDDWIELFNNSAAAVDLSGRFLSDDTEELTKWAFPEGTTIPSGGFLIVWADEDLEQEGLHADFRLSAGGESVVLTDTDGATIIDAIDFTEQTTDISFARRPNGMGDFQFSVATFDMNNGDVIDCSNNGGDMDNDGICADEDCDDTDPSIGAAQEPFAACDDGDDTTALDNFDINGCICAGITIIPGDLVINELLAANETSVLDQDGEAEDYIELFNNSVQTLSLDGFFLSDDPMEPTRWAFPAGTTIEGRGYLTIFADNDVDQAGLHANFRLSDNGESVILSTESNYANVTIIVDAVDFPEQTTDISYGRFPNGTGPFQFMNPTFGAVNNNTPVSTVDVSASDDVKVFPNPTSDEFTLEFTKDISKQRAVTIYHVCGQEVYRNTVGGKTLISTAAWSPGMYIIRTENAVKKLIKN